ncbi:hypothetical protein GCM10022262_12290 [Georgenia daeguensis]|uniref:Glycosyltransferase n=1 Tax=Georgenia daeguensis TaxID=908355 RepID=A0ABP8ESL1_9MICO
MESEGLLNRWRVFVPEKRVGKFIAPPPCVVPIVCTGYASSRNAALTYAIENSYSHIIFIDDDELPVAGWSAAFRSYWESHTDVQVLLGPVYEVALGKSDASAEDIRPPEALPINSGPYPKPAYSGNTCLSVQFIKNHGLRFDPALDDIGGEDTRFFSQLSALGAETHFVREAFAFEFADHDRRAISSRWNAGRSMSKRRRALGPPYFTPGLTRGKAFLIGVAYLLRGILSMDRRLLAKAAFRLGLAVG